MTVHAYRRAEDPASGPSGMPSHTATNGAYWIAQTVVDGARYELWSGPVPDLDTRVWTDATPEEFAETQRLARHRARHTNLGVLVAHLGVRPVAPANSDLLGPLRDAGRSAHAATTEDIEGTVAAGHALSRAAGLLNPLHRPAALSDAQVRARVHEEIALLQVLAPAPRADPPSGSSPNCSPEEA